MGDTKSLIVQAYKLNSTSTSFYSETLVLQGAQAQVTYMGRELIHDGL